MKESRHSPTVHRRLHGRNPKSHTCWKHMKQHVSDVELDGGPSVGVHHPLIHSMVQDARQRKGHEDSPYPAAGHWIQRGRSGMRPGGHRNHCEAHDARCFNGSSACGKLTHAVFQSQGVSTAVSEGFPNSGTNENTTRNTRYPSIALVAVKNVATVINPSCRPSAISSACASPVSATLSNLE